MSAEKEKLKYKLSVLGFTGAGKTTLIYSYVDGHEFDDKATYDSGIEDTYTKTIQTTKHEITLDIHDSGVGTVDRSWQRRQCHGILIVFDVANLSSFQFVQNIPKGLTVQMNDLQTSEIPLKFKTLALIGNKVDLTNERAVDSKTAQLFCEEQNLIYLEVSALTRENVDSAFHAIIQTIHDKMAEFNQTVESQNKCCVLL